VAQDLSTASNWYELSKQTDSYVQMVNINFCRISVIKKEKAVELFHKALEMRQRLYGDKHPDVIKTKNYLKQIENRC